MKNLTQCAYMAIALAFGAFMGSCNGTSETTAASSAANNDASATASTLNIRYVDGDSLAAQYNLAKDLNEAMLRNQSNFENVQRQRAAEIQKFGNEMQHKYENNGYLSEASFKADQQKLQKMQADAETQLANLQRTYANEAMESSAQLKDSIYNYMKIYALEHGYEIILEKSATLYIDPKYDVTAEVVKGLNERYVKVKK